MLLNKQGGITQSKFHQGNISDVVSGQLPRGIQSESGGESNLTALRMYLLHLLTLSSQLPVY